MQIIPLKKISVLFVDDHELVREGIARILKDAQDIEIAEQLSTTQEVLEYISATTPNSINAVTSGYSMSLSIYQMPDIILLGARILGTGDTETIRALVEQSPACKIIAMPSMDSGINPTQILRAGARGFITKSTSVEELLRAVRTVAAGGNYVASGGTTRLASEQLGGEKGGIFDKLSRRELQISLLLTEGTKVSQISKQLELSPKTVYSYRYRIFEKLAIRSDVELTLLAVKQWPSRAATLNRNRSLPTPTVEFS